MYTDIELFKRILDVQNEELQKKLLFWLEKQLIFKTLLYSSNAEMNGQEKDIRDLFNNTYYARHKWLSNRSPHSSVATQASLSAQMHYLAAYLDYDVKNELKQWEQRAEADTI